MSRSYDVWCMRPLPAWNVSDRIRSTTAAGVSWEYGLAVILTFKVDALRLSARYSIPPAIVTLEIVTMR